MKIQLRLATILGILTGGFLSCSGQAHAYANYASSEHPFLDFRPDDVRLVVPRRRGEPITQEDADTYCRASFNARADAARKVVTMIQAKDGYMLWIYPTSPKPFVWAHLQMGQCIFNK